MLFPGLEDVLMSVNRVSDALEKLPEHRKDVQFLRQLFADQEIQNAIEVTSVVNKHWSSHSSNPPVTSEAFKFSDEVYKPRVNN